ncbi:hypothetical protein CRYUN_Cryun10bG0121100 [Craigia yunnanensis]
MGGFDRGKQPPVFDQIIGRTKWSVVNTTEDFANGLTSYYEVIVVAPAKTLSVCLSRNEQTDSSSSPFISAIEVLSLDDSMYNSTDLAKYALVTVARSTFGNQDSISVSTSEFCNKPPAKAFVTAITRSPGKKLEVQWPPVSLPTWPLSGQTHISLTPVAKCSDGPLINAGEIYQILPLGGRTHTRDVAAMEDLVRSFDNPPPDWRVTYSEDKMARVVSLHLEKNNFIGPIPKSFGKLGNIREIFLQNKDLDGSIPDALLEKKGINLQVSPGNLLSA